MKRATIVPFLILAASVAACSSDAVTPTVNEPEVTLAAEALEGAAHEIAVPVIAPVAIVNDELYTVNPNAAGGYTFEYVPEPMIVDLAPTRVPLDGPGCDDPMTYSDHDCDGLIDFIEFPVEGTEAPDTWSARCSVTDECDRIVVVDDCPRGARSECERFTDVSLVPRDPEAMVGYRAYVTTRSFGSDDLLIQEREFTTDAPLTPRIYSPNMCNREFHSWLTVYDADGAQVTGGFDELFDVFVEDRRLFTTGATVIPDAMAESPGDVGIFIQTVHDRCADRDELPYCESDDDCAGDPAGRVFCVDETIDGRTGGRICQTCNPYESFATAGVFAGCTGINPVCDRGGTTSVAGQLVYQNHCEGE